MAFLRKWGTAASGNPALNSGGSNGLGSSAAGQLASKDGTQAEWHLETPGEHYFGMENFGNTCYANSVLQSLYFSRPFRQLVESYRPYPPAVPPTPSSPNGPSLPQPIPSISPPTPASVANSQLAGSPSNLSPPARSPPSARPVAGGSRGGFFSRQRQGSNSTTTSDVSTPGDRNSSPPVGTPLTHTLTNSSFTGVGQPVVQNGGLAREVAAPEATLLTALHDLFTAISAQPKSLGTVAPQAFINQLKRDNEFFRSTLHQDAHEFLNFLVNALAEILEKEERRRAEEEGRTPSLVGTGFGEHVKTWVHSLFEGILTNETRCLTCETVTSRDEAFLDLSIDIEQNSSVTSCLRQFSASEMLCQRNKFSCDKCCGLQEAEKRMKVKKLPNLLALHLKRFKYEESLQRHVKLTYRVVFPFELRLFNTADDVSNPDRLYELWAIVVHIGVGPTHGHYITIVKSGTRWIVFDDNNVYPIEQSDISRYFGDTPGQGSAYCLFYQAVDIDAAFSGLPVQATAGLRPRTTTTSSVSTGGATGVSAGSKPAEEVPPIPPLPPAAIGVAAKEPLAGAIADPPAANATPAQVPIGLVDPTGGLDVPAPNAAVTGPSPALSNGLPLPRSDSTTRQQRKASLVSLSSSAGGDRDRDGEKSGWSLKGRFSRTKSQATTPRSSVGPGPGATTPASASIPLEPAPPVPIVGENDGAVPATPGSQPPPLAPVLSDSPPGSPTSTSASIPPFSSPTKTNSTLPNEDDRASTVSGSNGHAKNSPTPQFARRRDSRTSASDVPLSSSVSSSIAASPHLNNVAALSTSPASNGPLSATRNLFSRNKPRPQSASGTGLGLSPGPPAAPAGASGQTSNLRASFTKRPSTASPVVQAPEGGAFVSTSRSFSGASASPASNLAPILHDEPSQFSSSSSSADSPAATPALRPVAASPPLSKKEAEKRLKEEKKAREQEAKARDKREKEAAKQMKEDAKRQEKLRRKMSTRG
ncbi:hypothetical protein JCM10212_000496 [Sporobolomyces blumeae]